ncbi:MAG: molecular chaperone DnaK [Myxococcota bacterium]|nr:molecular chaperone DnaK [Myxococcota bacterium]
MGRVIGIDLGTTNSVISFMDRQEPAVVVNEEGSRVTPSVVSLTNLEERLVGESAKRQLVLHSETTIHSVKRFMGKSFEEAQEDIALVNYTVKATPNGGCGIVIGEHTFSPQEISAMILQKLKASAEDFIGEAVTDAVITVPAYFTDRQRQATRDAGMIAGLNVLRIINEPTAAALSYLKSRRDTCTVAVYDFGGGTFDVSILDVDQDIARVRATRGNTALGGADVDWQLVEWLLDQFQNEHGLDVAGDKMVLQRLRDAAERAKIELSFSKETEVNLPFLVSDTTGPKHLQVNITREIFEGLIEDLIAETIEECVTALEEAGLATTDIDEVILVGGSSRIPLAQQSVQDLFGKALNKTFNPDEVVAIGASIQSGILEGEIKSITLLDVTNFSLGIETEGRRFSKLIPKGTHIPTQRTQLVSTVTDNQTTVRIHVLQGEKEYAKDNVSLGEFELQGVPPGPRGSATIQVKFSIDSNGIVNVSAKETSSGVAKKITIKAPTSLNDAQLESLRDEASSYQDQERDKKLVDAVQDELKASLREVQKWVMDHAERIGAAGLGDIEGTVNHFQQAIQNLQTIEEAESLRNTVEDWRAQLESQ